jgi:hypothetical protein
VTNDEMLAIALGIKPGKIETVKIKTLTDEEKAAKAEASRLAYEARQAEYMEKYVADLYAKRDQAGADLDRISRLRSEFPDLRVETDRWKKTRFKAKSANSRVTAVEIRRTCGCCHDPGILAMPYMETTLGRVYSDPFHIEIGEGRSYDTVYEHTGWEERYRKHGISEEVIAQARSYIDAELARNEDDED